MIRERNDEKEHDCLFLCNICRAPESDSVYVFSLYVVSVYEACVSVLKCSISMYNAAVEQLVCIR